MENLNLIFSAHPDDAAFCLGGAILNGLIKPVSIYSVFTISDFTLSGRGDISAVSMKRKEEDFFACRIMNSKLIHLGFKDACIRAYGENYMDPKLDPRADPIFSEIKKTILKIVSQKKAATLFFPRSFGFHIDHRILYEIGKELIMAGFKVIFYQDVPYPADSVDKDTSFSSKILQFDNIDKKLDLVKIYKSQVDEGVITEIKTFWEQLGGEKIYFIK